MARTTLKLNTPKHFVPDVRCNGRLLCLKRLDRNTYSAEFDAPDGAPLDFHVFKHYSLSDKLWYVYGLFFWIVGFFGIFSPRWEKRCPSLDVAFTLEQSTDTIELTFYPFSEGGRAFSLIGEYCYVVENDSNVYTVNTLAQRRAKKVKLFSWLTFLACVIAAVIIMVLSFT